MVLQCIEIDISVLVVPCVGEGGREVVHVYTQRCVSQRITLAIGL